MILIIIAVQVILILTRAKTIEITSDYIKTKNIELQITDIEKIIIEGYFIQKVGIKQHGKRLVSSKLHFRFKDSEESQIKELVTWAEMNGIKVENGKIFRWI